MANSDFKFPDEVEEQKAQSQEQDIEISVQADDDVEIDIVDDTPEMLQIVFPSFQFLSLTE